jgi:phage protein D
MHTYPMKVEARQGKNTIKHILQNNEYNIDIIQKKAKQNPKS